MHTLIENKMGKKAICLLLEPAVKHGYESKYIPLLNKYIDFTLFVVYIFAGGDEYELKKLREEFEENAYIHVIPSFIVNPEKCGFLSYVLYLVSAFFHLLWSIPKIQADAVANLGGHAYTGFIVTLISVFTGLKSVVRISEPTRELVKTTHFSGSFLSALIHLTEKIVFSYSDIIVANRDMTQYSIKIAEKFHVISQGVDISLFNPDVEPTLLLNTFPRIVTVSRLSKEKNIQSLIESVRIVKVKYPEALLLVVGNGQQRKCLELRRKKLRLGRNVVFLGFVNPWMIPGILKSCDIFVLPSASEGLPSAVLEAMACGVPTVISFRSYNREKWFLDRVNVLMSRADPQSIAEAVIELASDSGLRQKLIQNGITYVRQYHDSKKEKKSFTDVLDNLIRARKTVETKYARAI